jgi:DNA-binding MarR family transcriptional regulator
LIPSQFELSDNDMQVLQALARHGAMQPSQLAAETLMLPADLNKVLGSLADMRLVIIRPDETPDGQVVILTTDGKQALGQNMLRQKGG